MPPKPSEKRSRISSSEDENSIHVLKDDAILVDIQRKLEKLNMLDKLTNASSRWRTIWALLNKKPSSRKRGLTQRCREIKEDVATKTDEEQLQALENEVEELRNRSRRNNLVFYNIPGKAEGRNGVEFIQNLIANHKGLESHCGYVEIERTHRTPTYPAYNKRQPRPIHVALPTK